MIWHQCFQFECHVYRYNGNHVFAAVEIRERTNLRKRIRATPVDFSKIKVDFSKIKVDFSKIKVDFSKIKVDFSKIKVDK